MNFLSLKFYFIKVLERVSLRISVEKEGTKIIFPFFQSNIFRLNIIFSGCFKKILSDYTVVIGYFFSRSFVSKFLGVEIFFCEKLFF